MIQVSDATRLAFKNDEDTIHLSLRFPSINLELTDSAIVKESLSLKESIEENSTLTFTGCIASVLQIEIEDLPTDLTGQRIELSIRAGSTDDIPLFSGIVESVTNKDHNDLTMEVTAYDDMYRITNTDVTSWYNSLRFPITVKAMRDSLMQYLAVDQETTVLPNDTAQITKTIRDANINAGDILKGICQINARFGQINRYGKLRYIKLDEIVGGLYPAEDLYPSEDLYPAAENASELVAKNIYRKIQYEPYKTELITGVYIHTDKGATHGAGTKDNAFHISSNKIADGLSNGQAVVNNLLQEVNGLTFNPNAVWTSGMPYLECGDIISLNTYKNLVRGYILSRTLSGIQDLVDFYDSDGDQFQPPYVEKIEQKVNTATNTATTAKTTADSAQKDASDAKIDADAAKTDADAAKKTAGDAVTAVGTLRAEIVEAKYVKADQLEAVDAKFSNLNANNIKSGTLSADRIDASSIAGKFSSATNATFGSLNATSLKCTEFNGASFGGRAITLQPIEISINGHNYTVIAHQNT